MASKEKKETELEHLQTQVRLERSLRDITNKIHSCTLDEILMQVKEDIRDLVQSERVTIYAVDKTGKEIFSRVMEGSEVKEIRVPISKGSLAGFAAASKKFLKITDAYDEKELAEIDPELKFDSSWDVKTKFKTTQVMACPSCKTGNCRELSRQSIKPIRMLSTTQTLQ